jgi:TonB family protein
MGLKLAQSQYVAYVRQRIFRINERIAPKGYQDILPGEVVAEFSLVLDRGGRIKNVRLTQSCGYATLDKIARQAISLAEPFDGFPPELSDPFEVTVWVKYH